MQTVVKIGDQDAFKKIRELNPVADLVVDYFSKRERTARRTGLMDLKHQLERKYNCSINWDQLVATFRDGYQAAGAGSLVTGKTADEHAFEWGVSLVDASKVARGEASVDSIRPAPTGEPRVVYKKGYKPKKVNPHGVFAKREGKRGRPKGAKNRKGTKKIAQVEVVVKTAKTKSKAKVKVPVQHAPPRIEAKPDVQNNRIEVMVIEHNQVKRYEVPQDKSAALRAMLPVLAVAK